MALITGAWASFNLVLLLGALGALFERRQRRMNPRMHMPMTLRADIKYGTIDIPCHVTDVSATGIGISAPTSEALKLPSNDEVELVLKNNALGCTSRFNMRIRRTILNESAMKKNSMLLGLEFNPHNLTERREIVALVFGDSELMQQNLFRRQHSVGAFRALGFLLRTGMRHTFGHLNFLLQPLYWVNPLFWIKNKRKLTHTESAKMVLNAQNEKPVEALAAENLNILRKSA